MGFITFLFLLITPYLGHPNWEYRELATDVLSYSLPFSSEALKLNLKNENCEIYKRSLSILNGSWFNIKYIKLIDDCINYNTVKELIYTDYEDYYGLPWLPSKLDEKYGAIKYRKILSYFAKNELKLDWEIYNGEDSSYLYGINDIRFYVRGLGHPTDYNKFDFNKEVEKWKELKKTWRKK